MNRFAFLGKIKIFNSLKTWIFLIVLLVGLVPCLVMRTGILQNYENRAVSVRTNDVQNQLRVIANHLITYGYLTDTNSEVINAELEQLSNLYDGRVIIINDRLEVVKDTYGISEKKTVVSEEVIKCLKGEISNNYDRYNGYIEITTPITETVPASELADDDESDEGDELEEVTVIRGVMLTSVSTDSIVATMDVLGRNAQIISVLVMMGVFGVAFLLARVVAKPFEKVSDAIHAVKEGFTNEPISVRDYQETAHIVDAFNEVLVKMNALDASRQEFVANVSHELKTPITSVKVLADSLNAQEDVPVELYREFMVDIAAEIDRENHIINDLLALVKLENKVADINIESVNVNELIERILKQLHPIADPQGIELIFDSKRQVVADIDEVKFSMVISNLVENAIKYNNPGGWVRVELDADHQYFSMNVVDSGIGIPQESLDHVFDRFYRVDKSHSREIGGTGLGLAITRSTVLLHKGAIKVSSELGKGTTFSLRIPLNYIASSEKKEDNGTHSKKHKAE